MHVYVIGTQPINALYKKKWLKKETLGMLKYITQPFWYFPFFFFLIFYEIPLSITKY